MRDAMRMIRAALCAGLTFVSFWAGDKVFGWMYDNWDRTMLVSLALLFLWYVVLPQDKKEW